MAKAKKAEEPQTVVLVPGVVMDIPIDMVMRDETQPRTDFDQTTLQALADSIKARGQRQPITIRSDFVIEDGERRWRACKLAGKATVRAILAEPADDAQPELERAFDQVIVNHHRDPLNAMEWAAFLLRLRDQHGMKVEQIAAALEARGIKHMSRSYISNLMRLSQLPEWAQEQIKTGQLTAAHGKHLLTAVGSEKVLDQVKQEIKREADGGDHLTTSALQEVIYDAYAEQHPSLDEAQFDTRGCQKCEHRRKVSAGSRWHGDGEFCMNPPCYDEKEKAAEASGQTAKTSKEKAPRSPTEVKPGKNGIIKLAKLSHRDYEDLRDAPFDTAVCQACEHNKQGSHDGGEAHAHPTCFNVAHYQELDRAWARGRSRRERVAEYLDNIMRARIGDKLPGNDALQFQVLAFAALGFPGNFHRRGTEEGHVRFYDLQEEEKLENLPQVLARFDEGTLPVEKIVRAAVGALDRGNLYRLARYCGIALTPETYQIDAAYIALCKKADIAALTEGRIPIVLSEAWRQLAKGKLADMQAFCLKPDVIAALGVPRELEQIYAGHDVDMLDGEDDDQLDMFAGDDDEKPADDEGADDNFLDDGEVVEETPQQLND